MKTICLQSLTNIRNTKNAKKLKFNLLLKKLCICTILIGLCFSVKSQTVTVAQGNYKNVILDPMGDYIKGLILLHPMYNGALLETNYTVGTLTAMRGSSTSRNRLNVVNINTSSSYNATNGTCTSTNENGTLPWKLKTCIYNGTKYLALEIPYISAQHSLGYKFNGWATSSTDVGILAVPYFNMQTNLPLNQTILTNIEDYTANMYETHEVNKFNITGNLCLGTVEDRGYKLAVNGKIRAQEIKVESTPWPDYVFEPSYTPASLTSIEQYIKLNKHLPEIPSATEIEQNGVNLGEMNAILLKKIEEITLHLIEQNKKLEEQSKQINILLAKNKISDK